MFILKRKHIIKVNNDIPDHIEKKKTGRISFSCLYTKYRISLRRLLPFIEIHTCSDMMLIYGFVWFKRAAFMIPRKQLASDIIIILEVTDWFQFKSLIHNCSLQQ